MSRQQHLAGAGEGTLRSHHIDAIAHHFLTGDSTPRAEDLAVVCRDVAVAAPVCGPVAACAAAGLAAAVANCPDCWGSYLIEDEDVDWSAFSHLGAQDLAEPPLQVRLDLPRGLRAQGFTCVGARSVRPRMWLRWRLLGEASEATLPTWEIAAGLPAAARAAPLRWSALVWCVVPGQAAASASAACLGRLVTLLRPDRVEILVVPEAWNARPGVRHLVGRQDDPGWRNPLHLQEIARAAVGPLPTSVRVFPEAPMAAGAALLGEIAASLAGTLPGSDER